MGSSGRTIVIAVVLAATLASPAPAHFVGTSADPGGDAVDPARDIVEFTMGYSRRTGALAGAIRLARAPTDDTRSLISLFMGIRTPSGCNGYPAAGFGSYSDEFGASWLRLDAAGVPAAARGEADKRGFNSAVQTFEATDDALAGRAFDCVLATLSEPGDASTLHDAAGPIALVGQPALSVRMRGVKRRFRPGIARRVSITIANTGDGATEAVRLRLGWARGLRVAKRLHTLDPIAAGARRTIRPKITLTRGARDTTALAVKAAAGILKVSTSATLTLHRPATRGDGGEDRGAGDLTRLCNRYQADFSGGGQLILVPC